MIRGPEPATCSRCGQRGDQPPGLKLDNFPALDAVFVVNEAGTDTDSVIVPQRLTCRTCGHSWAVARGSVEVRPSRSRPDWSRFGLVDRED